MFTTSYSCSPNQRSYQGLEVNGISFVNSQGSPSECTFNGMNYGSLNNGSYSQVSAASGILNPAGKYRYYWNICGVATRCESSGVSACQVTVGRTSPPINIGFLSLGSFGMYNSSTQLKYTTTSRCSSGNFRTMIILFKCSSEQIGITASLVQENFCIYQVEMRGELFCSLTPSPSPTPSTPSPTLLPTLPPSPSPTPSPTPSPPTQSNGISISMNVLIKDWKSMDSNSTYFSSL
ncbi:hypothetical protein ACTA71_000217 [Dictyostelium dimigraforme]